MRFERSSRAAKNLSVNSTEIENMTDQPSPVPEIPSGEPTQIPIPPAESAAVPIPAPAPPAPPIPSSVPGTYIWGTGRRKTSVARVRIRPGDGKFVVNKREVDKYFLVAKDRQAVRTPLEVTQTIKSLDVFVNVNGGGTSGQSGAVLLGLARALSKYNPEYLPMLKEHNLMTRDPRKVERKKYGQSGARKRFQFSKR